MEQVSLELPFGYEQKGDGDEAAVLHRSVEFGRRPTARQFLKASEDADGSNTMYQLALRAATITKFGELTMPVPMTVLLSLNQIDRAALDEAHNEFMAETKGNKPEVLEDGTAHLVFGLRSHYQIVFGQFLSGYSELEIEKLAESEADSQMLRLARQIKGVRAHGVVQEMAFELDDIANMDTLDYLILREAESRWLKSFRSKGK